MNSRSSFVLILAVAVALLLGVGMGVYLSQPVHGEKKTAQDTAAGQGSEEDAKSVPPKAKPGAPPCCPRYSVVFTEGTNLCVTDNQTNLVYYYTIDPEKEPGSPIHLRGTVDLNQVGQKTITPKLVDEKK